jgi:hypothetical protein
MPDLMRVSHPDFLAGVDDEDDSDIMDRVVPHAPHHSEMQGRSCGG